MEQRNIRTTDRWTNEHLVHGMLMVSLWALVLGSIAILLLSVSGFLQQLHVEHFKISYSIMWFLSFLLHFFVPMVRKMTSNIGRSIGMGK